MFGNLALLIIALVLIIVGAAVWVLVKNSKDNSHDGGFYLMIPHISSITAVVIGVVILIVWIILRLIQ